MINAYTRPVLNVRRSVSGTIDWYRAYDCEACRAPFVGLFRYEHTSSKSADVFKSRGADEQQLLAKLRGEMAAELARYQPFVSCPACGQIPRAAARYWRFQAIKAGALVALVLGAIVALISDFRPIVVAGWAAAIVLLPLLGAWLGGRALKHVERSVTRADWDELLAGGADPFDVVRAALA
jgi:hypothetical protein